MRNSIWLGALALSAALLTGPACAKVTLEAKAGIGGYALSGAPVPLRITVTNSGEAFRGRLILSTQGRREPSRTEIPVSVSARGRSVYFAVCHSVGAWPDLCDILLRDSNGSTKGSTKAKWTEPESSQTVLCAIGESSGRLSIPMGLSFFGRPPAPPPGFNEIGVPIEYPPMPDIQGLEVAALDRIEDSAQASDTVGYYGPAGCLLLTGFSPRSASPQTLRVVEDYAAAGGVVLVTAAPDIGRFDAEFFRNILPVTVERASSVTLPGSGTPIFYAEGRPKTDARVFLRWGDTPVLTGRPYGAGSVFFLSVDPTSAALQQWGSYEELLEQVLSVCYAPYDAPRIDTVPVTRHLAESAKIRLPGLDIVGSFLLAYLLVVTAGNFLVLNRLDRKQLLWLTTPAVVLIFTAVAWGIGARVYGRLLTQRQIAILYGRPGEERWRDDVIGNLLTPATRTYTLSVPRGQSWWLPSPFSPEDDSEREDVFMDVTDESSISKRSIHARQWTINYYGLSGTRRLKTPLKIDLRLDAGGKLRGTVTNISQSKLVDIRLYCGNDLRQIKSIKRGETMAMDNSRVVRSSTSQSWSQEVGGIVFDQIRDATPGDLSSLTITALSPNPAVPVACDPPARKAEAFSVYVMTTSIDVASGQRTLVRPGRLSWARDLTPEEASPRTVTAFSTISAGIWQFRVGDIWTDLKAKEIELRAKPEIGPAPRLSYWDWQAGGWQPVPAAGASSQRLLPQAAVSATHDILVKANLAAHSRIRPPEITLRY